MKKVILGLVMLILTQFAVAKSEMTENKIYKGKYVSVSTSRFGAEELFIVTPDKYLKNLLRKEYNSAIIKVNTSNGLPEKGDYVYVTNYKYDKALVIIEDGPQR